MAGKSIYTEEIKQHMAYMYTEQRLTLREIGKRFSCDHKTVLYHIKKYVSVRRKPVPRKVSLSLDTALICKLYTEDSLAANQIAVKFSVSKRTILDILHENNVVIKSRSDYILPYAERSGYAFEHGIAKARKVYEDYHNIKLQPHNVIHHIDGNKLNNSHENLQFCENAAEHKAIESNIRWEKHSLKKYGRPDIRICRRCRRPDVKYNLMAATNSYGLVHYDCNLYAFKLGQDENS